MDFSYYNPHTEEEEEDQNWFHEEREVKMENSRDDDDDGWTGLELAVILFEQANKMGMMKPGYVWIVPDGISSPLDSVDSSVLANMQGVLGFKSNFLDNTKSFKRFKLKFRRNYGSEYPEEEEHSNPSIFALRSYDAIRAFSEALMKSKQKSTSKELVDNILSSNFYGLSGQISFKHGELSNSSTFRIINVVGKSYREIAFWSPENGFTGNIIELDNKEKFRELEGIYWPGGEQKVPKGWSSGNQGKPLKIGVPAKRVLD